MKEYLKKQCIQTVVDTAKAMTSPGWVGYRTVSRLHWPFWTSLRDRIEQALADEDLEATYGFDGYIRFRKKEGK